jgi:hypothetical protein
VRFVKLSPAFALEQNSTIRHILSQERLVGLSDLGGMQCLRRFERVVGSLAAFDGGGDFRGVDLMLSQIVINVQIVGDRLCVRMDRRELDAEDGNQVPESLRIAGLRLALAP